MYFFLFLGFSFPENPDTPDSRLSYRTLLVPCPFRLFFEYCLISFFLSTEADFGRFRRLLCWFPEG